MSWIIGGRLATKSFWAAASGIDAAWSGAVRVGSRTPMTVNASPLRIIVSPGCLSYLRAMSDPRTATFEPSSAAVLARPSAIVVLNVSSPWSAPGTLPEIIGGTPIVTALAWSSISIITAESTTFTPSTARILSAMASDIGALANPPSWPLASATVILSA